MTHKPLNFVEKNEVLRTLVNRTDLTKTAIRVFFRLLDHQNPKSGQCNPSNRRIAKTLGISERSVRSAISELKQIGAIKVRKGAGNRSNQYQIQRPDNWQPVGPVADRKQASADKEGSFLHNRNSSSSKKKKKNEKKKGASPAHRGNFKHPPLAKERCPKDEDRFHGEIKECLMQTGRSDLDIFSAPEALLENTYCKLLRSEISRSAAVNEIVTHCLAQPPYSERTDHAKSKP